MKGRIVILEITEDITDEYKIDVSKDDDKVSISKQSIAFIKIVQDNNFITPKQLKKL